MKKFIIRLPIIAAVVAVALFAGQAFALTPVERHGALRVEDGRIVNKNGDPVQLRGVSLYWSIAPAGWDFYKPEVIEFIASDQSAGGWNVDVVRAAMGVERNFNATTQRGYIGLPDANRDRVITVVDAAIEAGIYVIIDWHSYVAEINTDKAIEFFEDMVERYGNVPNVIFEIYNEPNGSGGDQNDVNGQVMPNNRNTPWGTIKDTHMQPVTDAIRNKGSENLIFIGTPNWCQYVDTAVNNPVQGNNLVYTAHFYANQNDPNHRQNLRSKIYYAMKSKKQAVFISEFGLTNANGHGALATTEADKWFAFLDEHKIGWAAWSFGAQGHWGANGFEGTQGSAMFEYDANGSPLPGANGENWESTITDCGKRIRDLLRSEPTDQQIYNYLTVNIIGEGSVLPTAGSGTSTADRAYAGFVFDKSAAAPTVHLRATPASGGDWVFAGWEGDIEGTDPISGAIVVDGNKTVTARFTSSNSSVNPRAQAAGRDAKWSVRRVGGRLAITAPAASSGAYEVALYDVRGRQVRAQAHNVGASNRQITLGHKLPAGNYMLVIRNKASKRETYSTRVTVLP